jgi:single-strand DNA-binding protein
MGKSVNKVILLGHVGKDPEIRTTNGGTLVANLSLATTDRYKESQGEWQDRAEWHNLAAYARAAEILRDYVKKGSKLYVEGKLTTRSWDDKDSGKKMYRTEIVVNDLSLLSGNEVTKSVGNGGSPAADQKTRNGSSKGRQASRSGDRQSEPDFDYDGLGITEGDLPPF